jgi:4-amino-4-deoxy-L-arabinose transferase-like glycosyltransferase
VLALVSVYAVSFFCFYPTVMTNDDESAYIRQARLVLEARSSVHCTDPLTGEVTTHQPSRYPVGTAVLMAPFVWAFGWRGAFLTPMIGLVGGILLTALWIREARGSPLFALLILGFPSALILGRVGMSDVPSMAVVAFGLWLFWRGQDRGAPWWFGAGVVAGASMVLREPNCLPFVPFFAGAVLRREPRWPALLVGGVIGSSLRLISSWVAFGEPFFYKAPYMLAPDTIVERLPIYLIGLLVFVPGALIVPFAYRGRRRPEVLISIWLFFFFYLIQHFDNASTSFPKRLVLTLRYIIPILPVVAFAMADATPRLWRILVNHCPASLRVGVVRAAAGLVASWIVGLALASVGVHWAFDQWSAYQARIRDTIREHVPDDAVLVTNWWATRKFIEPLDRRFVPVLREEIPLDDVLGLGKQHSEYFVALLDRTDSEFWREQTRLNAQFVAAFEADSVLEIDVRPTPTDRVRIWRVRGAAAGS